MQQQPSGITIPMYSADVPVLPDEEPFRVTFTGHGIEVMARLTDLASADQMIRSIEALKLLLRTQTKKPGNDEAAN